MSLPIAPTSIYRLAIASDELVATLQIGPAAPDEPTADVEGALAEVARSGISQGVDAAAVSRAVKERGAPIVVATGRRPVDGEDGRLEVDPKLLEMGGRPRVRDDGGVDLFELNLIHTVRENQVLARRIPPTPGEPGVTVKGRVLPAHRGKPAPGLAGRGARLTADGIHIIASLSGHAVVLGDQLGVSTIYQVRGDVGVATGHISFIGSVVVRGDVRPGFHVKADGDIEIHGNVNGGIIEAGGNVSVRYGILGQGRVVAAGTARAKFVEYADVQAGADVWVADGIVQSKVRAGTRIEVLGRYGSVVGGHVFARKSLTARQLGSARGIRTTIAVGADPRLQPEANALKARLNEIGPQIRVLESRLDYFDGQSAAGRLNRRGAQEMESTQAQLQVLIQERETLVVRQREVAAQLADISSTFVDAQDVCHTGVLVLIGTDSLAITQAIRSVRFHHSARLSKVELVSLDR